MALTKIDDRGLKTPIDLLDNEKIRLGTGNDLEIYHNSSHSYIDHTGTGDLWLRSTPSGGDIYAVTANNGCFVIQNASGAVQFISCSTGSTDLYYDGTKTLETTAFGVNIWNGTSEALLQIIGGENQKGELRIVADDGDDNADKWSFQARTDGNLNIQNYNGGSWVNSAVFVGGGAAKFYNDNVLRFQTTSAGAHCWGDLDFMDNAKIRLGTNSDLQLVHDGTNSRIKDTGSGNLKLSGSGVDIENAANTQTMASFSEGSSASLYHANSKKFETTATGAILTSGAANTTSVRFGNTANRGLEIKTYQSAGNNDSGVVFNAADSENNGYSATLEFDLGGVEFGRFDGNYDILKLSSACNGITFNGDWAAVNRLNDYEEGTWTPSNSTVGFESGSSLGGSYTKIGNRVFFDFRVRFANNSSGVSAYIDGFPFTSAGSGGDHDHGLSITYTNSSQDLTFLIGDGASRIYIYNTDGNQPNHASLSDDYVRAQGQVTV